MEKRNMFKRICYVILIAVFLPSLFAIPQDRRPPNAGPKRPYIIDVHNHLSGRANPPNGRPILDYEGAAKTALQKMDVLGIKKMLIMPPPFPPGHDSFYDYDDFTEVMKKHPDRFGFLAGGGILNEMIQKAIKNGKTDEAAKKEFKEKAYKMLADGALGFGEFAGEHLCLGPNHNHQEAPPNHPLFLILADIAAEKNVPIDIHMEAVPHKMPLPRDLKSPPNPAELTPNIEQLEKLLSHNEKAKIIWCHAGWDQTGERTAELTAKLLEKHPNLYLSIKICNEDCAVENSMLDNNGNLRPEWLEVIKKYPDRFMIGSDQFYISPMIKAKLPPSADDTISVLAKLPKDIKDKIASGNAVKVFNLK